jgi:hypothetical protein
LKLRALFVPEAIRGGDSSQKTSNQRQAGNPRVDARLRSTLRALDARRSGWSKDTGPAAARLRGTAGTEDVPP